MQKIRSWIAVARVPFLVVAALPFVFGSALGARASGRCDLVNALLGAAGLMLLHAGANMLNEYYDHKSGVDTAGPKRSPFSGGSRIIQRGFIEPKAVFAGALAAIAASAAFGVAVAVRSNFAIIMGLGLAGALIGYLYTAPPVKLSYRGLGELAVFLAFGPLLVLGGFVSQTGRTDWGAALCGVPIGLATAMILFVNEFPDIEPDASRGKRTLVVKLGAERATRVYGAFAFVFLLTAAVLSLAGALGRGGLFGTIIGFFLMDFAGRKLHESPENACSVSAVLTLLAHHAACIWFTVGVLLTPDAPVWRH